jgi:formate dehydrogenase subunit gamma
MIRDPKDLKRYTASERLNHWTVGMSFILLAISGLAFFHPAFFPLSGLLGGPVWARILHPYIGVLMAGAFFIIFMRFKHLNTLTPVDKEWLKNAHKMVDGNDHDMPEQGKYNGGQKMMFWGLAVCMLLMTLSGFPLWRAWFHFDVTIVRLAAVVHAAAGVTMIGLIMVHVYAAIWVKGTIRAMWYGTVTRAWAKQHHRAWYRQVTGK